VNVNGTYEIEADSRSIQLFNFIDLVVQVGFVLLRFSCKGTYIHLPDTEELSEAHLAHCPIIAESA
jgi:hypothetical protein